MDRMERWVAEQNVDYFLNLLQDHSEEAYRIKLKKLLIEEVDRFDQISERFEVADRALDKCLQRIADQRHRIDGMNGDDANFAVAKVLLVRMLDIEKTVRAHRDNLKKRAD